MHFARKPVNRLQGSGREVLGAVYIYIYICYIYVYMQEHTRSRPPVCIYARWGRGKANKNAYAVNQICMCTGGRSKKTSTLWGAFGRERKPKNGLCDPDRLLRRALNNASGCQIPLGLESQWKGGFCGFAELLQSIMGALMDRIGFRGCYYSDP